MEEENALEEGGRNLEPIETRTRVDGASSLDGGGATPPAAVLDTRTNCIGDDSDQPPGRKDIEKPSTVDIPAETDAEKTVTKGAQSVTDKKHLNDGAEDQGSILEDRPLDGRSIEKSASVDIPAETGAVKTAVRDNIATAVSKSRSSSNLAQSVTNKKVDELPTSGESSDANPSTSLQRLNKLKNSDVKSQDAPPSSLTSKKSMPQSRRSPAEGENEEFTFGPFVDPVVNSEWNPFGEGDIPLGEILHVDDDIQQKSNKIKNNGPYERKALTSSNQTAEAELDSLRRVFDSEYERAIEDQEISWMARYGATRGSFIMSTLLMIVYLWLGCMFYSSVAGWSIPDALLFTVYTVTTVGYGGPQRLPNTAAFHAFTSVYVIVGISLMTVLGAHTYQLVTLEATRMRSSPLGRPRQSLAAPNDFGQEALTREMDKYRHQFMNELEDLAREQPLLDAMIVKIKNFRVWRHTTQSGRVASVALPFLGNILLGAVVVGTIEEWSPLESIYWSIVTLTTVGYGDYTPTKNSSVWFCTLFFIPSSLFFLSFLLAHVAKSYIRHHAIQVARIERKMRRKNEQRRKEAQRAEKAKDGVNLSDAMDVASPPSPGGSAGAGDMEHGFTISYADDEDLGNSSTKTRGLFGDEAGNLDSAHNNDPHALTSESSPALRYRERVMFNKEMAPDPQGNRAVSFAEAVHSLNQPSQSLTSDGSNQLDQSTPESQIVSKPSLDLRLRVQARLARIIAEEVAGHQTGVVIKGSTVRLTVGSLHDTSDKWKIPPQAWKAFRAVSFRSLLFVGERDLIADGGDALLRLNVVEFHQIFSPMLAAMGDGRSMETWLAATDVLADVELRGGARYGRGKPIFNGTFT